MLKIFFILAILLTNILLSSCWPIPLPRGDTPDGFTKNKETVKSLLGSTIEEIETRVGEPKWVVLNSRKIYYVYEWWSDESDILMIGYIPMPWVFTSEGTEAHCILLEFGNDKRLRDYEVDTGSSSPYSDAPVNCLELFGLAGTYYTNAIEMFDDYSRLSLYEIKLLAEKHFMWAGKITEENSVEAPSELFLVDKPSTLSLNDVQEHLDETIDIAEATGRVDAGYQVFLLKLLLEDRMNFMWLCRSAESGYVSAQIKLGYLYRSGTHEIPRDYTRSYMWYLRAASEKYVNWLEIWIKKPKKKAPFLWCDGQACYIANQIFQLQELLTTVETSQAEQMLENWETGQCEREIFGIHGMRSRERSPYNPSRLSPEESSWKLYKEVGSYCPNADLGDASAQKRIGDLYYQGLYGLHKDLTQAYVWYSLAANGGDNGAAEQVNLLRDELSIKQLNEAQHQLEQWEPGQCERDLMKAIPEGNE